MTALKKRETFFPAAISDLFDNDRFWSSWFSGLNGLKSIPSVNIRETAQEFILEVAAPGMTKKDFKVHLEDNMLAISAEKQENKEEKKEKYTRREFSYESFSRNFTLPEGVNTERIVCKYEDGILQVYVPKKEETSSKPVKEINVT